MAVFNFAPTAQGKVLFADVQAGAVLIPTKMVVGTGSMPSGKLPVDMTAVVTPLKELEVTKLERTPDGFCIFGCVLTNEDVTAAFYLREIALYARAEYRDESGNPTKEVAEVCLIYGNSGDTADLYPAYSTSTVIERTLEIASYVGNDVQIQMAIRSGVYITRDEMGVPGGVVALDEFGNVDMHGGVISGLGAPVHPGDAVPKSYADGMLPLNGGTMRGPVNMNAQRVYGLPVPVEDGDAVPKSYADKKYSAPANILVNSDFTNPVNRLGGTSYSSIGETIDRWNIYYSGYVSIEGGVLLLSSTTDSPGEFYQPIDHNALVVGKTYTAAAWLFDGSAALAAITVASNQMVNVSAGSFEFAISTITGRTGLFLTVPSGVNLKIKHIALYEGAYTAANLPDYRPIGYTKEAVLCMYSPNGIILREGKDYGTSLPSTGVKGQLFFLEE